MELTHKLNKLFESVKEARKKVGVQAVSARFQLWKSLAETRAALFDMVF